MVFKRRSKVAENIRVKLSILYNLITERTGDTIQPITASVWGFAIKKHEHFNNVLSDRIQALYAAKKCMVEIKLC